MEDHKKYLLGHRAFLIFLSKKITPIVVCAIVAGAAWYVDARWVAGTPYGPWGWYVVEVLLALTAAILLIALLRTYIEYKVYTYMFTDEAFVMTFGYFVHSEVTALYHQIQSVNIERGMSDRLAGVSNIVIVMAGGDRDSERHRIVLPAIAKKSAKLVQKEILVRARKHMPGYYEEGSFIEGGMRPRRTAPRE